MRVTGPVLPRTGESYAMKFSHSDKEIFQAYLDHANKDISFLRSRDIFVLDKASWYNSKSLDGGRHVPIFLSPYSPDLNLTASLCLLMKAQWFDGFYAKT